MPLRTDRRIISFLIAVSIVGSAYAAREITLLEGTVTRVLDGDTINVSAGSRKYRVRLAGIDAPEHDQSYGDQAGAHLRDLLLGNDVRLESNKVDKYGRLVAKVWVQPPDCHTCGKTLDASMAMLTGSLAWWYRYYKDEQSLEDRERYEFAEYEAKSKGAGLWADAEPTPPWDWPRGDRKASEPADGCTIKGNISGNGKIYHLPGQRYYDNTRITPSKGERWFCSEAEARAAGWRRART